MSTQRAMSQRYRSVRLQEAAGTGMGTNLVFHSELLNFQEKLHG